MFLDDHLDSFWHVLLDTDCDCSCVRAIGLTGPLSYLSIPAGAARTSFENQISESWRPRFVMPVIVSCGSVPGVTCARACAHAFPVWARYIRHMRNPYECRYSISMTSISGSQVGVSERGLDAM